MKIAIAQINPTTGNIEGNIDLIKQFIQQAKEKECDLVVFPELSITGAPLKNLLERSDFCKRAILSFEKLVSETTGIGVICGNIAYTDALEKKLYNTAFLFEDGNILHQVRKENNGFSESRFFEKGLQNQLISYKGKKIGLFVGDIEKEKDIQPYFKKEKMDFFLNIVASDFWVGKETIRKAYMKEMALKYQIPFLYVNQVGGNDSILFEGGSFGISGKGNLIVQANLFEEDFLILDMAQETGDVREISITENDQILNALSLGIHDYLTKNGFTKIIVGVSGGVDSALVLYLAVKAIGAQNVHAVFLPTRYTSEDSHINVKTLSDSLSVRLDILPIDHLFQSFVAEVAPDFNPMRPDIVHQNIQARIRGMILMAISNKEGSLLLSTGNKSEVAMGYCTLYGDMCGSLSVLSDVWKTSVWELCRCINQEKELIPNIIIEKDPSAELAPLQKDQDDLPPYEILDPILMKYLEQKETVEEIVSAGFSRKIVQEVIARVCQNEYKRIQAAPGLKISRCGFLTERNYPLTLKNVF